MITKFLDSRSVAKVWKTAARQKFCAIVSKICRPLRGHILFKLCSSDEFLSKHREKNYIGYLKLRRYDNVKSVIV